MPIKYIALNDREYEEANEAKEKTGFTDREIYLRGLGLAPEKRVMGRPRRKEA